MSYLREQDELRDHSHDDGIAHKEHELTLSTAAIFGIFFGQAVLCAIFFGFGYSLGGHHSIGNLPSESSSSSSNPNFNNFKPAAGQPAPVRSTAPASAAPSASTTTPDDADTNMQPDTKPAAESKPCPGALSSVSHLHLRKRPARRPLLLRSRQVDTSFRSLPSPSPTPKTQPCCRTLWRAKGYAVSAKPGSDNFIHLLLGPFPERSGAEAMRQRLLTDGYTAYIK